MTEFWKAFYKGEKQRFNRFFFLLYDSLCVWMAGHLTLALRFDFNFDKIPSHFIDNMLVLLPFHILLTILLFLANRLYTSLWEYAGVIEMQRLILASLQSALGGFLLSLVIPRNYEGYFLPRSYHIIYFLLFLMLTAGARFSYRAFRLHVTMKRSLTGGKISRVMLIGAGETGHMVIRDILSSASVKKEILCIIDDNKNKIGSYINGIRVVGDRSNILEAAQKFRIDEIIIAIPSASRQVIGELTNLCTETKCKLKITPSITEIVEGHISATLLRDVSVTDLLGREPVNVSLETIMGYVSGKTVLVTGGGGSIGSELCRQLARNKPARLIIFDIYENNAYEIEQELRRTYQDLNLVVLIGSVRNEKRLEKIFETYRPNLVYHAAAHKHVPLMEDSPNEAVKNNVMGTYNTVKMADKYGVDRFVLISTDKAVNPTNVMGATKRICEMIIQSFDKKSKTGFVAVRFGNVLGSNGSVIPLFKKQIAEGGPVTVTDENIIRYFMTIPEAVSLVLQAGAYAEGGEIFVLDMGEPVKILDLAKNLIKLSGLIPYEEIEIKITGLRPGEKLYEELLMDEEGMKETENKLIHIGQPIQIEEGFFEKLEELRSLAEEEADDTVMKEKLHLLVPTYLYSEKSKG